MAEVKKTAHGIEIVFQVGGLITTAKDVDVHIVSGMHGEVLEILLPGMAMPATLDLGPWPEIDTNTCRVRLKKTSGSLVASFSNKTVAAEPCPEKAPHGDPMDLREAEMFTALANGDSKLLHQHLQSGLSPSVMGPSGYPILCIAACHGSTKAVELLLNAGADLEGRTQQDGNSGQTALHVACWNVQEPVVNLLLAAGANPNARDEDGETPLMVAARLGSLSIVKLLAHSGADPAIRDGNEWLAAEKAAVRGHAGVVSFLGDLLPGAAEPHLS